MQTIIDYVKLASAVVIVGGSIYKMRAGNLGRAIRLYNKQVFSVLLKVLDVKRATDGILANFVRSCRSAEVKAIQSQLETSVVGSESFVICAGPKGVGKSTAVTTAVLDRPGVVRVEVKAKMDLAEITRHAIAVSAIVCSQSIG